MPMDIEQKRGGAAAGCRCLSTHDGSAVRPPVVRFVSFTRALLCAHSQIHLHVEGKTMFDRQDVDDAGFKTIKLLVQLDDL